MFGNDDGPLGGDATAALAAAALLLAAAAAGELAAEAEEDEAAVAAALLLAADDGGGTAAAAEGAAATAAPPAAALFASDMRGRKIVVIHEMTRTPTSWRKQAELNGNTRRSVNGEDAHTNTTVPSAHGAVELRPVHPFLCPPSVFPVRCVFPCPPAS